MRLQASDIMLWHVPNEKKAYEMSEAATFKYHTNNTFLNHSTLRDLYAYKLPLKQAGKLKTLLQIQKLINIIQQSVRVSKQLKT